MSQASITRLDLARTAPDNYEAMNALAERVDSGARAVGLEPSLLELVRITASRVNGCAFCLTLHTRQARENGETETRLSALATGAGLDLFTPRERAALTLTESVTLVHADHVPDPVYQAAAVEFAEDELAQLLWVVTVINAFNRLAIATRLG
jgi:AhpD family alkylhydroperoxidase